MKRATTVAVLVAVLVCFASLAGADQISVNQGAALAGTYGLEVNYDGAPSRAFVQSRNAGANPHPWDDETGIRVSFLIDPGDPSGSGGTGTFDMGPGGEVRMLQIFEDFTQGYGVKVVLFLKKNLNGNAWRMSSYVRTGTSGADGFVFGGEGYITGLTPAWGTKTQIDFEWQAASAPGANDGRVMMTYLTVNNPNATPQTVFNRTDLDNDDHVLNILNLGSISTAQVGNPEGFFKVDNFVLTRLP